MKLRNLYNKITILTVS